MTWTTPKTWVTGEALTASDLNTHVRDNLDYLKDAIDDLTSPPTDHYECDEASDYTTTSTSFVAVDSTNLRLTITTNGGDVLIVFTGSVANSAAGYRTYLDIEVDDASYLGDDDGLVVFSNAANYNTPPSLVALAQNLSAGEHTFELHWKVEGGTATLYAGAGTSNKDVHPAFWVREVS